MENETKLHIEYLGAKRDIIDLGKLQVDILGEIAKIGVRGTKSCRNESTWNSESVGVTKTLTWECDPEDTEPPEIESEHPTDRFFEGAKVGDQVVFFRDEESTYTVQARTERFIACTFPYEDTVMYCVVDVEERIRGPESLILGLGAETREECEEMVARMQSGETEVSRRRCCQCEVIGWNRV